MPDVQQSVCVTESEYVARIIAFLKTIGIFVEEKNGVCGFVNGIEIVEGKLLVDTYTASASSLLHEAGHIAITPLIFRTLMTGDLRKSFRTIFSSKLLEDAGMDSELSRACMQMSDPEATAWAFSVGRHLGVPDHIIIRDEDYEHKGAEVRFGLSHGAYVGIHGLQSAGMCYVNGFANRSQKRLCYPELLRWTQK